LSAKKLPGSDRLVPKTTTLPKGDRSAGGVIARRDAQQRRGK
jgi:hypothetical protein